MLSRRVYRAAGRDGAFRRLRGRVVRHSVSASSHAAQEEASEGRIQRRLRVLQRSQLTSIL